MKEKVCIIGGNGFLGKALTQFLLQKNFEVHVVGRNAAIENTANIVYSVFEEKNTDFFDVIFKNCSYIFHLAYAKQPNVNSSGSSAEELMDNMFLTEKILNAACRSTIKKFIFISSGGAIYGNTETALINEKHSTNPISVYGLTKLTEENLCKFYYTTKSLPVVIVRPSNVYGIGQIPFAGQGFIATAIASILQNKDIIIFGKNGTLRDYIYISDIMEALFAIQQFGIPGETYNISTAIGYNNIEIIEWIQKCLPVFAGTVKMQHLPERSIDVKSNVLDNRKMNLECNWTPKITISDGLAITANWLIDQQMQPLKTKDTAQ